MRTTIDKILQAANGRIHQWAVVEVKDIEFSEEVVAACRANYCGNYNKSWMCPPHVGTLEELKSRYTAYRYAFVFTTRHEVEDSFDIEGMVRPRGSCTTKSRISSVPVFPKMRPFWARAGATYAKNAPIPNPAVFPKRQNLLWKRAESTWYPLPKPQKSIILMARIPSRIFP